MKKKMMTLTKAQRTRRFVFKGFLCDLCASVRGLDSPAKLQEEITKGREELEGMLG